MGNGASIDGRDVILEQSPLLATYKLLPDYQWSESHHCYTNRNNLIGIPEPQPPSNRKSDIFDVRKFAEVDERALQVDPSFITKQLPTLAWYLTKDYPDTLSKVRIIFRWITAQPIHQLEFPEGEPNHVTTLFQLWRIKNQKGNFAQLFSLMCSFAQIPCIIINGKLKGSSYNIGDSLNGSAHYGEWNAVLIDGSWRFVNAFWGACSEATDNTNEGERSLVFDCDDNYFLPDPEQFIYSHLSDQQEWQLLHNPISLETFTENVLLKDRYFNLNLSLNYPTKCVIYPKGEARFSFRLPGTNQSNVSFLALLSGNKKSKECRRYVFIERVEQQELIIRVRAPGVGSYKLEIVGKDDQITDLHYNMDWIAIYRIIFNSAATTQFPECPAIGWGPGNHMMFECGLAPMSHLEGEIKSDDGSVEVRFRKTIHNKMRYWGELQNHDNESTHIHMVYRVENDVVTFNVETPTPGVYAMKVYATDNAGIVSNLCNYMVVSKQEYENPPYPSEIQGDIGAKDKLAEAKIEILAPKSAYIVTNKKVTFKFRKPTDIELSALLVGDEQFDESSAKMDNKLKDDVVTYKVKMKRSGMYGFRLRAVRKDGPLMENENSDATINSGQTDRSLSTTESIYDAVIKFTKVKTEKKIRKEPQLEQTDKTEVQDAPSTDLEPEIDLGLPEEIKTRIYDAVSIYDDTELEKIISEIKELSLLPKDEYIAYIKSEIEFIRCRTEVKTAPKSKDIPRMEAALKSTYGKEYALRMEWEIAALKSMLERTKTLARLINDVKSLNQRSISEIKSYKNPPPVVHKVMMATLLLVGHYEEETQNWIDVQKILAGTVRDSIALKISKVDIDKLDLGVVLGANDFVRDISLEEVCLISAGAATFYRWVKGVVEEIEKRNPEDIKHVRPCSSRRQLRVS